MTSAKAFIFDFDGTLVDSKKAIYQCFESITKQLAPERIEYAKNILIGPPLRDTASEILGRDRQSFLDDFIRLFIEIHDEQVIQHTQPYPGVIKVLKQLHVNKIPMAIATNKRLEPTQKLIDHFGWNDYFLFIECSDNKNLRDKAKMINDIIESNSDFINAYFVGDTLSDFNASSKNSLRFIYANYGYEDIDTKKNRCYQIINSIHEVKELI